MLAGALLFHFCFTDVFCCGMGAGKMLEVSLSCTSLSEGFCWTTLTAAATPLLIGLAAVLTADLVWLTESNATFSFGLISTAAEPQSTSARTV